MDFNRTLSDTDNRQLNSLSRQSSKIRVEITINAISLGEWDIERFAYEVTGTQLDRASWFLETMRYEDVIPLLNELVQIFQRQGLTSTTLAQERITAIPSLATKYDGDFRDFSFAIRFKGVHLFVRSIYSFDNDTPFILYFEASRIVEDELR